MPASLPIPGDPEVLRAFLLNAVKPHLRAPFSAVLCEKEQLVLTGGYNGQYTITGLVHSQNAYGAMIATDFSVQAAYFNGMWTLQGVKVGALAAKQFAKNFATNYLAYTLIGVGTTVLLFILFGFLL